MTKPPTKPAVSKSRNLVYLESVLLGLCLCVIALRCTFTEGPPMQSTTVAANLGDNVYSLAVSAVLIFSLAAWTVWSFWSGRFSYRVTGIEIGVGVLCAAGVIAGFGAADKRLAITDVAVFLAPPLMALLLVQILDSQQKIRLVLIVVAALGAVSAYQCAEQYFVSNQLTIEQYEKEPETMLEPLGIEPGTFPQFLFEHRLYSKGVRGFFTTRNSAGSFALLALFAAIALFAEKLKRNKSDRSDLLYLLACGGIGAIILYSLVLTRSKGAFVGLFFAAAVFVVVRVFGGSLKIHRKTILGALLLLCIVGTWVMAWYGLKHGTLPGGGSMLVRWQYWHAAAKMYADHPLTGVGPGNFGHVYPHYKPAAALESVADPHNFPLSILTQYGPLGLIGFLAMLSLPLWRMTSSLARLNPSKPDVHEPAFQEPASVILVVVSAVLLLIRPALMEGTKAETFEVLMYVIVTVYVAPVAVFFIAFMLIAGPLRKEPPQRKAEEPDPNATILLVCAVLAVLVHNLIDFAIFEPGVLTTFWAIVACLIATHSRKKSLPLVIRESSPVSRSLVAAVAAVMAVAYLSYVLVPVAQSTADIRRANQAASAGQFQDAHRYLEKAAEADPLSDTAPAFNGRLYLHHFGMTPEDGRDTLLRSVDFLQEATRRNSAAFKNFERLTDVYVMLARTSEGRESTQWLDKALQAAFEAVSRYPGSGRLHYKLAQIAEQADKVDVAIEHYQEAIRIEDAYRDQFREIYPERKEVVSRLGEEAFNEAHKSLKMLREETLP